MVEVHRRTNDDKYQQYALASYMARLKNQVVGVITEETDWQASPQRGPLRYSAKAFTDIISSS
jgi:hypothetical protein